MPVSERTPTLVRGTTPQTPTLPAATAVGDWVTVDVVMRGGSSAACATPAGWTPAAGSPFVSAGGVANTDVAVFSFVRKYDGVWDGTMPSIAWTGDGTNNATLVARAFVGADANTFDDTAPVPTTGAGAANGTATLAQITTATPGAYVVHLLGYNASAVSSITPPDTVDFANANRVVTGTGHSGPQTAAGGSGTRLYSWAGGGAGAWLGIMRAVRPAGGATSHVLAATLQGVATAPASDLRVSRGLAGTLQGVGTVTADLRARRGLAGSLQGVAVVTADLVVVPQAPGRGPEDYETSLGPRASVTHQRRASLYVTVSDFPDTVVPPPGSRMEASIYVGRGASAPATSAIYRQADTQTKTVRLDDWLSPGPTAPDPGNFPAGTPATLATEDGSPLIRATGIPRCRVSLTGAVSRADGATFNPTFAGGNLEVDTDGIWTGAAQFVIPFAGQWDVRAGMNFAPSGVGARTLVIQRSTTGSGGPFNDIGALRDNRVGVGGYTSTLYAANVIGFAAGSILRLEGRQTSGGPLDQTLISMALVFLGPR